MYKLVVSDMDETFLDHHRIPEVNVQALRRMRELGVLFVPSSGRPYSSIMENFTDIDQSLMEGSYVISFNGGFINRYGDPKPLITCCIDREVAEMLYQRGIELGLPQHLYNPAGRMLIIDANESEREHLGNLKGIEYHESADNPTLSSYFGDDDIVKILFMNEDLDALRALGESMREELAERGIDITYSSKRYIEFVRAGVNKGTGLAHLAKLLGIDIADTIGVGDASNDLEMISAAGLGVGVANITDDVRPHCDVVLETSGTDGAFGELVERFIEPK